MAETAMVRATEAPTRRLQPSSVEAEESVVGGILLYPKAFLNVAELVQADDFYHPALKAIFRSMVELDEASKPIDSITVAEQMRANDTFGRLRAFNGESYFAELMSKVVTVENIGYHAKIVRGKATVRRLIETAQEIAARGYGEYGDPEDYLAEAQQLVMRVAARDVASGLVTQKESLKLAMDKIGNTFENRKQGIAPGIQTPFATMDKQLCGGMQSEFIVIGGRPSSGKSSLVLDIAEYAALYGKVPTLVISTEMSHESLTTRRLSANSGIDGWRLRSGELTTRDFIALAHTASTLSEALIWYEDSASDLHALRAIVRKWRAEPDQGGRKGPDGKRCKALVVVDYLQEIQVKHERDDERGGGRRSFGGNREGEIREIGKAFKELVKELDVTLVAVASLNRELEKREDKRPKMSDLRDSGSLEFQADVIAFVYRDVVYNPKTDYPRAAEVNFVKVRNGPLGMVLLEWFQEYTTFREPQEQLDIPEPEQPKIPSKKLPPRRRAAVNPHSTAGED